MPDSLAPRAVGPDLVHFEGRRLVVETRSPMPDWRATSYRRTAVVYEDRTYYVATEHQAGRRRFRYVLEPWPDDLHDRPARTVVYDDAYTAARNAGRGRAWASLLLWPVLETTSPLFGCLWSGAKQRLQAELGIDAYRATRRSMLGEYLLSLSFAVLFFLLLLDPSLAPLSPLSALATSVVALVDAAYRWNHVMDHPHEHVGVFEWLVVRS